MFFMAENLHMDWESVSIDFSGGVDRGKMLVIVGHSGSGKRICGVINDSHMGKKRGTLKNHTDTAFSRRGFRYVSAVERNARVFSGR